MKQLCINQFNLWGRLLSLNWPWKNQKKNVMIKPAQIPTGCINFQFFNAQSCVRDQWCHWHCHILICSLYEKISLDGTLKKCGFFSHFFVYVIFTVLEAPLQFLIMNKVVQLGKLISKHPLLSSYDKFFAKLCHFCKKVTWM